MTATVSDSDDAIAQPAMPPESASEPAPNATTHAVPEAGNAPADPLAEQLPVEWQAKLWQDVPVWRGVVAVAVVVLLWGIIIVSFADLPLAAAVLCIVVFASFEELFFPMRYTLTARDATAKCVLRVRRMPWSSVRKCYVDGHGVKLSPFDRHTKLETFRGIYLRFNPTAGITRERLIPIIKQLRDRAHGAHGSESV